MMAKIAASRDSKNLERLFQFQVLKQGVFLP